MLVLADRGVGGSEEQVSAFSDSGAELRGRAEQHVVLPVLERFEGGALRSELVEATDRGERAHGTALRVSEQQIAEPRRPSAAETTERLGTSIHDPGEAGAAALAGALRRWEIESVCGELKGRSTTRLSYWVQRRPTACAKRRG
jgi:hypothetical protein